MFWKVLVPIVSLIGFGIGWQARKKTHARTLVEDTLRFGRTKKEFAGAAKIANYYGWLKLARELLDKAKAADE